MNICEDHEAALRIFLDYRNSTNIVTICKIFHDIGANLFFPTVGYHHDDFFDNIIMLMDRDWETTSVLEVP